VVGVVLVGVKMLGAWLTGSASILSDALESLVNVVTAVAALFSIRLANEPADANHPLGHGKVEALTAALEGALLLGTGVAIIWVAVASFFVPHELTHLGIGLAIVASTALVNVMTAIHLIRTGRRHNSLALVADGNHLMSDVATSVGLLVGLGLVAVTGAVWIDSLTACLVAVWILVTATRVIRQAVSLLMDERSDEHIEHVMAALGSDLPEGLLDPHDLRVVDGGTERFLSMHAFAPRWWDLTRCQVLQDEVHERLAAHADTALTVVLKIEPCIPALCPECHIEDCPVRSHPQRDAKRIDIARLVSPEAAVTVDRDSATSRDAQP
jgi:cation diffusion facilitator family transporter